MNALPYIAAYLLGAITFGVFVLVVLVHLHNKPPGITKNARKPVDVPHREIKRQYRDAEGRRDAEMVEPGVRYEWINIAGERE